MIYELNAYVSESL